MTSDTELVERLRARRESVWDGRSQDYGWHEDALCVQAASAIERLCAERDEAREGGTPEAKRLLAQIDALTKRAEEAEREVERLAPLAVAYDYLESPARADLAESALSAANAEVERLRELAHDVENDGSLRPWRERYTELLSEYHHELARATALEQRCDKLMEVLRRVADLDIVEAALDPGWFGRHARSALQAEKKP